MLVLVASSFYLGYKFEERRSEERIDYLAESKMNRYKLKKYLEENDVFK